MSNWNIGPYVVPKNGKVDDARDGWQADVAATTADMEAADVPPAAAEAVEISRGEASDSALISAATSAAALIVTALGGDCTVGLYGDTERGAVTIAIGRA